MSHKKGIPSYPDIKDIFLDEQKAKLFLVEKGVLQMQIQCPKCHFLNIWNMHNKSIQCTRKNCRQSYSVLEGTFFQNCKLKINTVLFLAYNWLLRVPVTSATNLCGVSDQKACEYYAYFGNLVADLIADHHDKIGGPGIIVEIDESKFGSRKHYRGHRVEGVWVVGGVERTPAKRMFAVSVEDRSTETMKSIIRNNIEDGTIIYSDYWMSYDKAIEEINFEFFSGLGHEKVNHSEGFVSPDGICTNTIEGTWNGTKCTMSSRQKTKEKCPLHVMTFIWRRQNKGNLWNAFIEALKSIKNEDN